MNNKSKKHISVYCAVMKCENNSENYRGFFRFPLDRKRAKLWAILCDREDLLESNSRMHNSRLCAEHFESNMFRPGNNIRPLLIPSACPTIFPPEMCKSVEKKRKAAEELFNTTNMSDEDIKVQPASKSNGTMDKSFLEAYGFEVSKHSSDFSEDYSTENMSLTSSVLCPTGTQRITKKMPIKRKHELEEKKLQNVLDITNSNNFEDDLPASILFMKDFEDSSEQTATYTFTILPPMETQISSITEEATLKAKHKLKKNESQNIGNTINPDSLEEDDLSEIPEQRLTEKVAYISPAHRNSPSPLKRIKYKLNTHDTVVNYSIDKASAVPLKILPRDDSRKLFDILCDKFLTPEQAEITKRQADLLASRTANHTDEFTLHG